MSEDFGNNLITLTDEDGVEKEFEMIDAAECDGSDYVALVPTYDSPEAYVLAEEEWIILKVITDENGDDLLITIEDDAEFEKVADLFEARLEDEYEFIPDDEITQ